MALASLIAIVDELTSDLRAVYGALEGEFQIEPIHMINPSPPTIDVFPGRAPSRDPETAAYGDLGGGYWITVRARVDGVDEAATQAVLYDLLDDASEYSLLAAIEDAADMGGLASSVYCSDHSGFQVYPDASGVGKWLGFEYQLLVVAARS